MKLYFLRHGLAGDRENWHGDDQSRPLTEQGRQAMHHEAETIAKLGLGLELVLTSPFVRAAQTAEIVVTRLNMMDKLIQDKRLSPGCNLMDLIKILEDHPKRRKIMLVGHEPDFSGMISGLIGGGRLVCPKGGLARVDTLDGVPFQGELVWLLPPEMLTRSG